MSEEKEMDSVQASLNSEGLNGEDNDKDNSQNVEKAWYVINTFANHEAQVVDSLEKRRKNMNLENKIFRIINAEYEEPVLDKDGKQVMTKDKKSGQMIPKVKKKNYYPGYIFVEMVMDDYTWYVVRNTPGVSGITGSSGKGAKPFPVPREEIEPVLKRMHMEDEEMFSGYKVGDEVKILNGLMEGQTAFVSAVHPESKEVEVEIIMLGKPQTSTYSFYDIEKATDEDKKEDEENF